MKNLIIWTFLFLIVISINAEDTIKINSIFSNDEILKVKKGDIISRMYLKTNPEKVNTHLKIDIPKTQYTDEDFSVYEMIVDEKAYIPYKITEDSKLKLYNSLTSYSKLKGMVYYSRRIATPQELIINNYKVESVKNKKPLEDITYTKIQPSIINYFLQQDNKFGKFVYKSELVNNVNDFFMITSNMEPISIINYKGDNKFILFLIHDENNEGYYYYLINTMRIRFGLSLITGKTNATLFSNRLRASTVHLAKSLGLNWDDKLNPWDEQKLLQGFYRNY
jgi:hypothetical protein